MKWRQQRRHFFEATRQHRPPIEGDYYEWDYSRYARALGMTAQPGLKEQPHSCWAIAADDPRQWARTRARYADWAGRVGWDLVRLHARPSVVVPDPVVYQLGCEVCPDPELIFFMSGQSGEPVIGKRPRPPGCSIPISSGERWLMATDRIRRRIRNEIACRGLVLFIEEAEYVTAATLHMLTYLSNAHRAWRARMLARDARLYIVLATPPENETLLRRTLDRLDIRGPIPSSVAAPGPIVVPPDAERSRSATGADRRLQQTDRTSPSQQEALRRSIEQEHIISVLSAYPFGMTTNLLLKTFGSSTAKDISTLEDRGDLQARTEFRKQAWFVEPSVRQRAPNPPTRALKALGRLFPAGRHRKSTFSHVNLGTANAYLQAGEQMRCLAAWNLMPPGYTALTPLAMASEVRRALIAVGQRSSITGPVLAAAACSQFGNYAGAAAHLAELQPATTPHQGRLRFLILHLLSLGKWMLRRVLPQGFWASLRCERANPDWIEAIGVACDLFSATRITTEDLIAQVDALNALSTQGAEGANRPDMNAVSTLLFRWATMVPLGHPDRGLSMRALRKMGGADGWRRLLTSTTPAALVGSLTYTESRLGGHVEPRAPVRIRRSYSEAKRFWLASSRASDGRMAITAELSYLAHKSLRLFSNQLCDETLLIVDASASQRTRKAVALAISNFAGIKKNVQAKFALGLLKNTADGGAFVTHQGAAMATQAFLALGELGEAASWNAVLWEQAPTGGVAFSDALLLQCVFEYASLSASIVQNAKARLDRYRADLPAHILQYWGHCISGMLSFESHDFVSARSRWAQAYRSLRVHDSGHGPLHSIALEALARANIASTVHEVLSSKEESRRSVTQLVTRIRNARFSGHHSSGCAALARAEAAVDCLHAIEAASVSGLEVSGVELASFFSLLKAAQKEAFGHSGEETLRRVASIAPRLSLQLERDVSLWFGTNARDCGSTASLSGALGMLAIHSSLAETRAGDPLSDAVSGMRAEPEYRYAATRGKRAQKRVARYWRADAMGWKRLIRAMESGNGAAGVVRLRPYSMMSPSSTGLVVDELRVSTKSNGFTDANGGQTCRQREANVLRKRQSARVGKNRAGRVGQGRVREFAGVSDAAIEVRRLIAVAASCRCSVLILGETGSGKEVVARSIHRSSSFSRSAFVVADCAATVDGLMESELFGHEQGAFTGAITSRKGLFASANGGTLFLDEISTMSARMQGALLRVLDQGQYRPVGSATQLSVHIRLLSAGFPGIEHAVRSGEFREDLYYRIGALRIVIPPLRERREDITHLAKVHARGVGRTLTTDALITMEGLEWLGNVRQLQNVIKLAAVLQPHGELCSNTVLEAYEGGHVSAVSPAADGPQGSHVLRHWRHFARVCPSPEAFTRREFAAHCGTSERTAQRYLAKLVRDGFVQAIGRGRATRYRVSSHRA